MSPWTHLIALGSMTAILFQVDADFIPSCHRVGMMIRVQELLNSDPDGYAWGVWHDRTPKLITQIRDAHPYGPQQRAALDALWEEISAQPMRSHDSAEWAASGTAYFGRSWQDAPFLWSESYFYQRLLEAVGYFGPGPWQGVDPFAYLKAAELQDPSLEPDLVAL